MVMEKPTPAEAWKPVGSTLITLPCPRTTISSLKRGSVGRMNGPGAPSFARSRSNPKFPATPPCTKKRVRSPSGSQLGVMISREPPNHGEVRLSLPMALGRTVLETSPRALLIRMPLVTARDGTHFRDSSTTRGSAEEVLQSKTMHTPVMPLTMDLIGPFRPSASRGAGLCLRESAGRLPEAYPAVGCTQDPCVPLRSIRRELFR